MEREPTAPEILGAIERLRQQRLRKPGQPTIAERKAFGRTQAGLKHKMRLWSDPTLGTLLKDAAGDLARRQRTVAIAAAAWRELVPRDFRAPMTLVSFARGVLTVSVPDQASRFALDRMLRAGGLTHFIRSVPVAVKDVRIVVGGVKEPIAPMGRREMTVEDEENGMLRRVWRKHSGQDQ